MLITLIKLLILISVILKQDVTAYRCGPEPRIINGTKSGPETWAVELNINIDGQYMHHCGGSLISEKWIISAAHCFFTDDGSGDLQVDLNKILVSIGSTKHMGGKIFQIKNVYQKNYGSKPGMVVVNDISLVELQTEVPQKVATPIRLPEPLNTFAGQIGQSFGWGITEKGVQSDDLMVTNSYIMPIRDCKHSRLDVNKICVDAHVTNSIIGDGDSGGPLVVKDCNVKRLSSYKLVGVTSYSIDNIAVYARVNSYLEWIADITGVKP